MRSIAAIVIFGSTLFFLASIGLSAKAIADLSSSLISITSYQRSQKVNNTSSSFDHSSSNSFTGLSEKSTRTFNEITNSVNTNSDLITPSGFISSTSAGASATTNRISSPTPLLTPSQHEQKDVKSKDKEEQGIEQSSKLLQMNSDLVDNDTIPKDVTNTNLEGIPVTVDSANIEKEYQLDRIFDQSYPMASKIPILQIRPVSSSPAHSGFQKRLMLTSDTPGLSSSSSSSNDARRHHLMIALILFAIQEVLLIALLIGSLVYLWRYNMVDFDAEYKTILSRQTDTGNMQKSEDAITALRKRTSHIRTHLIFFCLLCLFLLAAFVSSFVLLRLWFTVNDTLTIITIALDALSIFLLIMICLAMLYDLRRSYREEHYANSEGINGAVSFIHKDSERRHLDRAPSIVSSIKSLSSFTTPPGWLHIRSASIKQKQRNEGRLEPYSDHIDQSEGARSFSSQDDHHVRIAHSQQPSINYDHASLPANDLQPGTQAVQYVGQPLRRLSGLEDSSLHQAQQQTLISPPIGTPPPQPGIDFDTNYPSHMLASLPSPSQQHFQRWHERKDEVGKEEDGEEWIGSTYDTNKTNQSFMRRQRRPSLAKLPSLSTTKPTSALPQSPVSQSPSSIYSDVLLSPGTLCVAVPNSHGGTTMMPVSVGQAQQTPL